VGVGAIERVEVPDAEALATEVQAEPALGEQLDVWIGWKLRPRSPDLAGGGFRCIDSIAVAEIL